MAHKEIVKILKSAYKVSGFVFIFGMEHVESPINILMGFSGVVMFLITQTLPTVMRGNFELP